MKKRNTNVKCESNNKNNVTYNEVDYVEQCITEGYDYRDCVDTLPGINDTLVDNVTNETVDVNNTGGKNTKLIETGTSKLTL